MLFRKTYSFQFPKNKDILTQDLKDLSKQDQVLKDSFGSDTFYSVEFNWDEFIVTQRAKMFQRASFTADGYIRLNSLAENLTQAEVKIKYSEVTWLFLIFIQLGIVAGCLFGNELNWLYRVLMMIGASGIFFGIIWSTLIGEAKTLKTVIEQLFGLVDTNGTGQI